MTYEDFVKINDGWETVGRAYVELGRQEEAYKIGDMLDRLHEEYPDYNRRRLAEKLGY